MNGRWGVQIAGWGMFAIGYPACSYIVMTHHSTIVGLVGIFFFVVGFLIVLGTMDL